MRDNRDDVVGRFDSYTKTALRYCLIQIRRKRDKLANNEKPFAEEDIFEFTLDEYDIGDNYINILQTVRFQYQTYL